MSTALAAYAVPHVAHVVEAASSSPSKTLPRLSIRSRCWTGAKSVAYVPMTRCVGESGVRSSGSASSRARSSASAAS